MEVKTHFLLILTSQERKSLREVHHLVSERFQQDHRTLSPVFSLLIVKPHLVQSVSFPGLFCPCPRLQLASGTLSSKPFLVGCFSGCQGLSDAIPELILWLSSPELNTLLCPSQIHCWSLGTWPAPSLTLPIIPLPGLFIPFDR